MAASGTTSIGTGSTLTFAGVTIQITSISIDGPEAAIIDAAHLNLAAGVPRPKLVGDLLEPGTLTAEGYLKGDEDYGVLVRTSGALVLLSGSGTTWTWSDAYLQSFSGGVPLEDVETCSLTWQLNSLMAQS